MFLVGGAQSRWAAGLAHPGRSDHLRTDEARERAREAIKRIRAGLPPVEAPAAKPDSFKAVAEQWLKRHVQENGHRSAAEVERVLRKDVFPEWGEREFVGIKRSDVAALLDKVEDEAGASHADHVLSIVRRLGNWYAARHDDFAPPIVRGMRRIQPEQRERSRVLLAPTETQPNRPNGLKAVWDAARKAGSFGALVRFCC